jgi:hypothetical protein
MASKQIRISITSALNAAGIEATKDQINRLSRSLDDFNQKQRTGANDTATNWAKLPGVFGKVQTALGGVAATAMSVIGAFKIGWDIGTWLNEHVIMPLLGIKDPIEELKKRNRELKRQAIEAAKAWDEAFQKWTSAWEKEVAGADRAIKKVDQLTKAYLEMQKARERVFAAGDNAELLKLQRDKFDTMAAAKSPEIATAAGKKFDIQIAEATARQKLEQFDRNSETAAKQLQAEQAQLAAAHKRGQTLFQQMQGLQEKLKYWQSQKSVEDYGWETSIKKEAEVEEAIKKLRPKIESTDDEVARRRAVIAAMKEAAKAEAQERANLAESNRLEIDERKKDYDDFIRETADKELEEERKTAEAKIEQEKKVAAERARLDAQEAARRERERQKELADRIRDHQKLLDAERQADSKAQAGVAAAESKLQQAWGWYRDKNSMAAQMAEEKADAAARKQFEKDFERLKDRRRDWRTAENLSVDDEAVRRVGLAREEKERAEQYAKETAENTRELAEKLDELLQVKG